MTRMEEAARIALKAATRDLVEACGGVERAGRRAGVSAQSVSRWQLNAHPEIIPLSAVVVLELDAGIAPVTAALARLNGRDLTEGLPVEGAAACIFGRHSEVMREVGEVMGRAAEVFADGQLSPTEIEILDRQVADLERATGRMRSDLARARASGEPHRLVPRR